MRSGRLVFVLLASMLLFGAVAARAEAPAGPRLTAIAFHPYSDAGAELTSLAADGSGAFLIAGGPDPTGPTPVTGALSWSADGSRVAFLGARATLRTRSSRSPPTDPIRRWFPSPGSSS